ncbi:MAG: DNA replication/repair protein RecF [Christensenellales bacterium]|jgi:DNA replication and repair protein RecF
MILQSVRARQFRNYECLEYIPERGMNVLCGDNAQGKTNLLEAIFLCCAGRSHRTSKDTELIRHAQDTASVLCSSLQMDGSHEVQVSLHRKMRKEVFLNGAKLLRLGEMMGHICAVLFSPEDLLLIKQGPSERRRFLDIAISQLYPAYFYALQKYNRVLFQRNRLLKAGSRYLSTLDVWDEQLIAAAQSVIRYRSAFAKGLSGAALQAHRGISSGKEELLTQYAPNRTPECLSAALKECRERDLRNCTTHIGPHRDDLLIHIDGRDTRAFASQGQQRTAALSLKIAQLRLMEQQLQEPPLLLLDDVLSELDESRRNMLFASLSGVQVFISLTDESLAPKDAHIVYVRNGTLYS